MREPLVLFQWGVSSYFGWDVHGLNMMLAWADRTDLLPATLQPIDPNALDLDPLERRRADGLDVAHGAGAAGQQPGAAVWRMTWCCAATPRSG